MRQLLYNALIANEGEEYSGYIIISSDGKIEKVVNGSPDDNLIKEFADDTLDLNGNLLMPGVIDSHVHFREPGGEHKATIFSESRAAVAGGVTSFMEMPNTSPATTTLEALEDKFRRAAKDSMANYSFYIGATKSNIDVLKAVDYSRVPGVKLFMGSSTGGMLVDGDDSLANIFKLPTLIATHCEDEATIKANTQEVKSLYTDSEPGIEWHPQIRNVLACYKSTHHAIELAKKYGTRLHIMHLTTKPEVDLLANAPSNITGEACVAHLMFAEEDYLELGNLIKCNPAVKSALHREALQSAVRKNIIDTISTDHAPHTLDEKNKGLFQAPSGMPMVQFSLPAILDLALSMFWGISTVVQHLCHRQADIFGVKDRGYIREGYAADLVQVDLKDHTVIKKDMILSKCGWSPLEGRRLHVKVKRTWVNGNLVYTDQEGIIEKNRAAQPLVFTPQKANRQV